MFSELRHCFVIAYTDSVLAHITAEGSVWISATKNNACILYERTCVAVNMEESKIYKGDCLIQKALKNGVF